MVGPTSYAALDLVWDTLDATIVLGQDMPACPADAPDVQRPILRPASTHPVRPTI